MDEFLFVMTFIGNFLIFLYICSKKHIKTYVINNSVLINKLKIINQRYYFNDVNFLIEKHTYDNAIFFNSISCEDYLIYQLQYKGNKIKKELIKVENNKRIYNRYLQEINDLKNTFDSTSNSFIEKIINKIEIREFNSIIIKPITNYSIKVDLRLSNIHGYYLYGRKTRNFTTDEINQLIKKLENKTGSFYNDKNIWNSISKVERGKVSNKMRFFIYERDNYRCCFCGRTQRFVELEIDHIKPIAKGGKSTIDNLQTLCKKCNKEKGDTY